MPRYPAIYKRGMKDPEFSEIILSYFDHIIVVSGENTASAITFRLCATLEKESLYSRDRDDNYREMTKPKCR